MARDAKGDVTIAFRVPRHVRAELERRARRNRGAFGRASTLSDEARAALERGLALPNEEAK